MKKVILKHNGVEVGSAIVEDEKSQEMADIYADNYKGEEYSIEVIDLSQDYDFLLAECIKNRMSEYPSPEDFMNAFFDGGDLAVQELQSKRLLIKSKYPKPVKE